MAKYYSFSRLGLNARHAGAVEELAPEIPGRFALSFGGIDALAPEAALGSVVEQCGCLNLIISTAAIPDRRSLRGLETDDYGTQRGVNLVALRHWTAWVQKAACMLSFVDCSQYDLWSGVHSPASLPW